MPTLKQLKWSNIDMSMSEWLNRCYTTCIASSNAVHLGEDAYIGIRYNEDQLSICKIIRNRNQFIQFLKITNVLPWSVEQFSLAAFKGALLVVGGQFTSSAKPAGMGEYSNKIYTLSQSNLTLPPMRSACASPAIVTHEGLGLIIVVHGAGADSGVEVLDTTIPNADWKQVEPLPYFSATPSATIVNGYLVVWIGTVYCMHLSCITADRRNTHRLPSNWMALPSLPESISLQLTSYDNQLAAFIISTDRQVLGYQFDQFHREWIKCCTLDTTSTAQFYQPCVRVFTLAHSVAVMWNDVLTRGRTTVRMCIGKEATPRVTKSRVQT